MPVLTVFQLTQAIKLSLEATFPLVCVQGEISNFKRQSSGHLYFSLKDTHATISCVMFRVEASRLPFSPKDGDKVILHGELNVYPQRGNYQLIVRDMHLAGLGELLLKLEALKAKLHQKGWFDAAHKKALPRFPKKIGVVTSPTGAVIRDILNVLSRRYAGFHLILNPVKVQGEGAAKEVAEAIQQFNQYEMVDVIIIARGGGSIEDLWAFNEEGVAEAIFNSRIPIICAVGHETDVTIADFVADIRAPTPSAAAEMVIAEQAHQLQYLNQTRQRLTQHIAHLIKHYRQRLRGIVRQPVISTPWYLLRNWMLRLDDLRQQLDASIQRNISSFKSQLTAFHRQVLSLRPTAQIRHFRQRLAYYDQGITNAWRAQQSLRRNNFDVVNWQQRLDQAWFRQQSLRRERLENVRSKLASIDPKNLLKRGYSILFSEKDHSIINSVQGLEHGHPITIMISDGQAKAIITETVRQ